MFYAQFYQENGLEGCGDRAVIILDGRRTSNEWNVVSNNEAKKRGFSFYSIHRGESFTRSRCIQPQTSVQ